MADVSTNSAKSEGIEALRRADLRAALEKLREAVRLNPRDPEACGYLGVAHGQSGELEQAIACLQTAVFLAPRSAPLWHNLGNALEQAGQVPPAEDAYLRANELNPDYQPTLRALDRLTAGSGVPAAASPSAAHAPERTLGLVLQERELRETSPAAGGQPTSSFAGSTVPAGADAMLDGSKSSNSPEPDPLTAPAPNRDPAPLAGGLNLPPRAEALPAARPRKLGHAGASLCLLGIGLAVAIVSVWLVSGVGSAVAKAAATRASTPNPSAPPAPAGTDAAATDPGKGLPVGSQPREQSMSIAELERELKALSAAELERERKGLSAADLERERKALSAAPASHGPLQTQAHEGEHDVDPQIAGRTDSRRRAPAAERNADPARREAGVLHQ